MARSDDTLRRVHRAYEGSHLVAALRALAIAAGLLVLALGIHGSTSVMWLVALTLAATLGVLAWRGGAWRRGALAGVLAGLPPLIVPSIVLAMSSRGHCAGCTPAAQWACVLACFGSGSLVGILVGYRAIADHSPLRFALAAIATGALTGLLGCSSVGLGGAMGVVIGLVAGGVTGWVVAGRTAHA
jgi:hypothetical protein